VHLVGDQTLISEKMHIELGIKSVDAKQAKLIYKYRNIKSKLLKSKASIWFNKVCKAEQLQPKYIDIKINGSNERSHNTKNAGESGELYGIYCWMKVWT
jgi:hypothetical protein